MKDYLNYLMHKKALQTIVLAMIPSFILIITLLTSSLNRPQGRYDDPVVFNLSIILMMIVLTVIVIFRFGSLRNAKEVDLFYALPISRRNLFLTHYLFGLIQAIIIWTVMFFLGLITLFIRYPFFVYSIGHFFILYIAVLVYIVLIYTLTTFVFLRARSIIDGIAFIILFQLFFLFVSLAFANINNFSLLFNAFVFNPFYALATLATSLMKLAGPNYTILDLQLGRILFASLVNFISFLTLAIFMFRYDLKNIEDQETEYIGSISSSKLGYLFYIPALLFLISFSTFFLFQVTSYLIFIVLLSAGFIGFFIYRRSLKIKSRDLLYIFIPMIIGILCSLLVH